ncbi:MAG: dTDP-rhamnosyl transferase [Prevotella sp.]|nr:dTDP-rhamnosyl transferase [Prevotella sp.]
MNTIARLSNLYHVIAIDNSAKENVFPGPQELLHYYFDGINKGIADAQNIGIGHLSDMKDITHVVFLDQDSRVSDDYPLAIAHEFDRIAQSKKLSVLGPSVKNAETGEDYKSVIHKDHLTDMDFIPRREVISSGSCTTIDCLKDIGLNDARLFIDYVDFEWCWRANSKGYVCGITPNLHISHHVGQKTFSLLGYIIIISSPGRYFYQFRNYLWLVRRKYVPLQWKIAMGIKNVARLFYFPLLVKQGGQSWKYMVKGIRAGLRK